MHVSICVKIWFIVILSWVANYYNLLPNFEVKHFTCKMFRLRSVFAYPPHPSRQTLGEIIKVRTKVRYLIRNSLREFIGISCLRKAPSFSSALFRRSAIDDLSSIGDRRVVSGSFRYPYRLYSFYNFQQNLLKGAIRQIVRHTRTHIGMCICK